QLDQVQVDISDPNCVVQSGTQFCVQPTCPLVAQTVTITFTFNPVGTGAQTCTSSAEIFITGQQGNIGGGGAQNEGNNNNTAWIIGGAMGGALLLALLLFRRKHGGGGGGGDDGCHEEGGGDNGGSKIQMPPGEVTAMRTEPDALEVRNKEPQELKV